MKDFICGVHDTPDTVNNTEIEENCLEAVKERCHELCNIGAANLYAAWIGIESTDVCAEYYDKLGVFDTGFLRTDILCDTLFRSGHGDTAYKLLSSDKSGSYLYMKRFGATTIWERWLTGGSSKSYPVFCAPCCQIFKGNYAYGSITTPKGRVSVSPK